jgi:charged multivesicular body protein 6
VARFPHLPKRTKTRTKKSPGGTISPIDRAVLDLKNSRDRLSRYKTKTTNDCDKLLSRAQDLNKNSTSTNADATKNTVLNILKLRKYKLKEVENVNAQLLTIEQMVVNIQTKEEEAEVLAALKTGKNALQKLHEENTVEDVLKLMEEVEEQNEMEREINDILVGQGERAGENALTADDMMELEAEMAAMEQEILDEKKTSVAADEDTTGEVDLPEVPDTKLPEVPDDKLVAEEGSEPARVAVAS